MNRSHTIRIAILSLALAVLLCFTGCGKEKPTVTYDNGTGISVVMQEGMDYFTADGFVMALADGECMMTAIRDDFATYRELGYNPDILTCEEYASLTAVVNSLSGEFTPDAGGNLHITYTRTVDGSKYFYYSVVLKGSDAFWTVTFACYDELQDDYSRLFSEWSGSIVTD